MQNKLSRRSRSLTRISALTGGTLLTASLLLPAAWAYDSPIPTLEHTALKRDMQGVCRTVFKGTEVEDFEFRVIDIMHGMLGPGMDIILAQLYGEKATYNGVVSGMSGSPCYIDGKLIGALSYRFGSFTRVPIAGITPIQSMLDIFDIPPVPPTQNVALPPVYQPPTYQEALQALPQRTLSFSSGPYQGQLQAIATPLSFNGFRPGVVEHYRPHLEQMGLQPVIGSNSGVNGRSDAPKTLEMGGAVAGQLVRGDISISGTGTVSYVEGDKVLAFGHPFFNTGYLEMPMATAYIQHILASEMGSFKMAEDGPTVGTLLHDRATAIGGYLNRFTPMIPVSLTLRDRAGMDRQQVNFEVFQNPNFTPIMMAMGIHNSLEGRLQYNLGGNLRMTGHMQVDGHRIPFKRFFSALPGQDVTQAAASELAQTLFKLWKNPFQRPQIDKLELDFEFRPQSEVAFIDQVWIDLEEVKPGESLPVFVRLRNYRNGQNSTQLRKLKVQVPQDMPFGPALLWVSSGDALDRLEESLKTGYSSYGELLDDLSEGQRESDRLYLKWIADTPGFAAYSQLYPELPVSVAETLETPSNISHSVPLIRSPGREYSYPVQANLAGQGLARIFVSTSSGRRLN